MGCTYRLISRKAYEFLKPKFVVTGNEFNPGMMLQVIRNKIRHIEIPIKLFKKGSENLLLRETELKQLLLR